MLIGHKQRILDLKRLANAKTLSHAYLFWGPERIGKRTVAHAFGNFLENGVFEKIHEGGILKDAVLVSPDAERKIGIDAVRELQYFLWQKPVESPRRLVIIDQGERLTPQAQDALLKIAENPPASSLLVLIVTNPDRITQTLRSRFQALYFAHVPESEIFAWLESQGVPTKKAKEAVSESLGAPGYAYARINDPSFANREKEIQKLFANSEALRSTAIKEFISRDDFDLEELLDGAIRHLAQKRDFARWHDFLELRKNAASLNLNPRIQLEALLQD